MPPALAISPDLAKVMDRDRLLVAVEKTDRPPFYFKNSVGQLDGVDIALAKDIASQLGVKVEFFRDAWTTDDVIRQVAKGKVDLGISRITKNLDWALSVNFSRPYFVMKLVRVSNRIRRAQWKSRTPFSAASTGAGGRKKTLGVQEGTAYSYFAKRFFPEFFQIPFKSVEPMLNDVMQGKIDAALADEPTVQSWFKANPRSAIEVEMEVFKDRQDQLAIAVHPEARQFLAWVNLYLEQSEASGQLDQLIERHFVRSASR